MVRTDSISDINQVIGEKRQRRDSDGDGDDDVDITGAVKDKWISKRPKLAAEEEAEVKTDKVAEASKADEDMSKVLDASFGAAAATKPDTGN